MHHFENYLRNNNKNSHQPLVQPSQNNQGNYFSTRPKEHLHNNEYAVPGLQKNGSYVDGNTKYQLHSENTADNTKPPIFFSSNQKSYTPHPINRNGIMNFRRESEGPTNAYRNSKSKQLQKGTMNRKEQLKTFTVKKNDGVNTTADRYGQTQNVPQIKRSAIITSNNTDTQQKWKPNNYVETGKEQNNKSLELIEQVLKLKKLLSEKDQQFIRIKMKLNEKENEHFKRDRIDVHQKELLNQVAYYKKKFKDSQEIADNARKQANSEIKKCHEKINQLKITLIQRQEQLLRVSRNYEKIKNMANKDKEEGKSLAKNEYQAKLDNLRQEHRNRIQDYNEEIGNKLRKITQLEQQLSQEKQKNAYASSVIKSHQLKIYNLEQILGNQGQSTPSKRPNTPSPIKESDFIKVKNQLLEAELKLSQKEGTIKELEIVRKQLNNQTQKIKKENQQFANLEIQMVKNNAYIKNLMSTINHILSKCGLPSFSKPEELPTIEVRILQAYQSKIAENNGSTKVGKQGDQIWMNRYHEAQKELKKQGGQVNQLMGKCNRLGCLLQSQNQELCQSKLSQLNQKYQKAGL